MLLRAAYELSKKTLFFSFLFRKQGLENFVDASSGVSRYFVCQPSAASIASLDLCGVRAQIRARRREVVHW